mmetsp:Transcript_33341/g.105672  ORF Transcript_33341/g.105672 Transcript_33341/m.105672 type:complete len:261 (-) Transcript_33341:494-1276(-)
MGGLLAHLGLQEEPRNGRALARTGILRASIGTADAGGAGDAPGGAASASDGTVLWAPGGAAGASDGTALWAPGVAVLALAIVGGLGILQADGGSTLSGPPCHGDVPLPAGPGPLLCRRAARDFVATRAVVGLTVPYRGPPGAADEGPQGSRGVVKLCPELLGAQTVRGELVHRVVHGVQHVKRLRVRAGSQGQLQRWALATGASARGGGQGRWRWAVRAEEGWLRGPRCEHGARCRGQGTGMAWRPRGPVPVRRHPRPVF